MSNNNYSLEVSKIFKCAENITIELEHPYVGTEHLLLSLMKNDSFIAELLEKYHLTYESFKDELTFVVGKSCKKSTLRLYTPLLKRVIKTAESLAQSGKLNSTHLLLALLEEGEGIAIRIMISMDVDIDRLYDELKKNDKKYNPKLEIFNLGRDLNEWAKEDDILVKRDEELNGIIETLIRKNKNNPLLVGDAGVGKSAIVEELARRINKNMVPSILKNKKIVALEMSSLVAGTKYRGEFEEKLGKVIKELEENPDIILFIDEMHTMTNAGGAEGAINASDILKPYLARGKIKIIGATTTNEYNKFIAKDRALSRRFELIKISEPNEEDTKEILLKIKPSFEKHYNIKITKENIDDIVEYANKYIMDRYNPDKSIDLLDSVCAMKEVENEKEREINKWQKEINNIIKAKEEMVKNNNFDEAINLRIKESKINKKIKNLNRKPNIISNEDIKKILYRKCNIPIITNTNKLYKDLEKHLNKVIVGQDKAIKTIITSLNNKSELNPLSLMLVGSTGVGKTKTVKEICEFLKMPLIRLDMSEYNTDITVNRLIGSSAGYIGYDDEHIFDKVKLYPRSCILLDEVEKASPSVLNLFLQILDEGFVTNAKGEKIDFKNTIIFLTSNAKVNKNIGFLKNNPNYQNNFSKEFVARINEIIPFNDITEDTIKKYLQTKGITDINLIKDFDYHNQGLRGIEKYLQKKYEKVS